ncbi:hypothetical protein CAPTEDRAFT_208642 [Capitella teleta]|uniref:Uncharacterized protein n=1 Tax=Capitella teleta TaxID=283909 RepID=R7U091_CAPTE|nr:hypothetical protein CAPTEDRAFT_208642 [Capitella teleta]|eukprot:ELT99272.1 hypothetical protein CAPTEDRAFT_208642 [Capitella teleta]
MRILNIVLCLVLLTKSTSDALLVIYAIVELFKATTHDLPDLTYYPPSTKPPRQTPKPRNFACEKICLDCQNLGYSDHIVAGLPDNTLPYYMIKGMIIHFPIACYKILNIVLCLVLLTKSTSDALLVIYAIVELFKATTHDLPDLTYYPPSTKPPRQTPKPRNFACEKIWLNCQNLGYSDHIVAGCYRYCKDEGTQISYDICIDEESYALIGPV